MTTHPTTWRRYATAAGKALVVLARRLLAGLRTLARFIALRVIPATWRWLRGTAFPALQRCYRWLPHRRKVVAGTVLATAAAISLLLVLRPDVAPQPASALVAAESPSPLIAAEPVRFAFHPTQAPPGARVLLSDVPVGPDESFEVTLGGEQIAARRLTDGRIQAMVPVTLGDDGWPVVPPGEQVLEVHRLGQRVGTGEQGLRITELPRAPGTTAGVQRSLATIVEGYERLFASLPAQDAEDMAYRRAVIAMLRGLVSEGDHSLAAVLAGTSPLLAGTAAPDPALSDALLASSGAAQQLQAIASALAPPQAATGGAVDAATALGMVVGIGPAHAQGAAAPTARCRQGGKDMELACLMQVQALLTDFSTAFVKPTADAYATIIALPLARADLNGAVTSAASRAMVFHNIVSALLSIANLVIEKIAPSMLPANLTRFEMEVATPLIRRHQLTRTQLMVEARNNPRTITIHDLIDLIKSVTGLPKIDKAFEHQAIKIFNFAIDLYMTALREQDAAVPNWSDRVNPGVFTLPAKRWGPIEVTSLDLIQLFSYDESILSTQERDKEWRGELPGQATVRVMPRGPGDRSKVLLDNTLCWGCVWSGGAFGTDMPHSSAKVAVELKLEAFPRHGAAPLEVEFQWEIMPSLDGKAIPCTLDFGDGSRPEQIGNCAATQSFSHTYPHTSRLRDETGGAYVAKLRIDQNGAEGVAEVFPDWTFQARPSSGKAPLDARFSWDIPWPPNLEAPTCDLDPGDGSERQHFSDCLATTSAKHRYKRRGSFAPSLVIFHGRALDTKTAPVSVSDEADCKGVLEHKAWTGTVAYTQSRDVWRRGWEHTRYVMAARLGGDLQWDERTKRYYTPRPEGHARLEYERKDYSGDRLQDALTFTGSGSLLRQTADMSEDGSALTLLLDEHTCTYRFHLQAFVQGSGSSQTWPDAPKPLDNPAYGMNAVGGKGVILSPDAISGTASFPVLTDDQIRGDQHDGNWVSEQGRVERALGEGNLGTVTVHWHFQPKK